VITEEVVSVPALVAGEWRDDGPWAERTGPYLRRVVSRAAQAGPDDVRRAARFAADAAPAVARLAPAARAAILESAARLAAERRDPDGIAAMRAAIADQRSAAGGRGQSFSANRSFHLALATASGNPHLTRFAEMLWVPRIGVPIYQAQAAEPAGPAAWADEHERIADAIERGDAEAAERLTRAHVAAHPPVARS